jgi:hypothetical protein
MSTYKTRPGDSPAIIARRHGTSVGALLTANPHKPTTVVAGKRTWQGLRFNERLNMPAGVGALGDDVGVGDAATDALHALVSAGGPCNQANVGLVCAAQRALGFTPGAGLDGKWGSDGAAAAAKRGVTVPACSPRPSWWTPKGQSNCYATTTTAAAPATASTSSGSSLDRAAGAAYSTLRSDPNYCASVRRAGTAVNTAVHNFKAAWNSANPSHAVPIGTGNYEVSVAAALSAALGGIAVPPGCGAAAASVTTPIASTSPIQAPVFVPNEALRPPPSSSSTPAAVSALASINPCLQANSGVVYTAQVALGLVADGKYGPGTSAAARKLVPNAPAACSPAPLWWGAKGTATATQATAQAKAAATTPVVGPSGTQCPEFSNWNAATGKCVPYPAEAILTPEMRAAAAAAAAKAQAADAAAKAAAAATKAQADQAAADAKAALDAAARAAAAATTQAQKDAADLAAKVAADALVAAQAKGGTAPGGNTMTTTDAKKPLSTGAIVAGAVGAAALVGLIALAVSNKTGHKGARGARGARGRKPARRKSGSKRRKSSKRRR